MYAKVYFPWISGASFDQDVFSQIETKPIELEPRVILLADAAEMRSAPASFPWRPVYVEPVEKRLQKTSHCSAFAVFLGGSCTEAAEMR